MDRLCLRVHIRSTTDATLGQVSVCSGFDLVIGYNLPASAALIADKGYEVARLRA